jgi:hypothetical protein
MIDISLAGLVGAIVGTAIAALAYGRLVVLAERALWGAARPVGAEERHSFEQERSMLRRLVLAIDIIIFAGLGYALGARLWD